MSKLCILCQMEPTRKGSRCYCKDCANAKERERWRKKSREKRRSYWIHKKYGLTYEEYEKMFNDQQGLCLICDRQISIETTKNSVETACVDHCHTTGAVRGLLCNHCNRALGLLEEDPIRIQRLKEYVA